jgi:hypothetical protein
MMRTGNARLGPAAQNPRIGENHHLSGTEFMSLFQRYDEGCVLGLIVGSQSGGIITEPALM